MGNDLPASPDDPARRWILALALAFLILASLPQMIGYAVAPPGAAYIGVLKNNLDALSYLAKMRQGWEGGWLYVDRYTTEPHRPALLFGFYMLAGHMARALGLTLMATFQWTRIGAGALLLFAVDRLIRVLRFRGELRILAFALAFTAGGFGWLLSLPPINETRPFEDWVIEGFCFQSMANYPHFAVGTALIALAVADLEFVAREERVRVAAARAAAAMFALAWVHPRLVLTVLAVGAASAVIRWAWTRDRNALRRSAIALACAAACAAGPMIATLVSLGSDPVWRVAANPVMPSPTPDVYFLAYGLLWPAALAGAWSGCRERRPWGPPLIAWLVVGAALVYLPFGAQRRLIQGYNIPLALLAAVGATEFVARRIKARSARTRGLALAGFAAVASLSTLSYLSHEISNLARRTYPWFIPRGQLAAMDWLQRKSSPDDVVICALRTGILVPALAGNRVLFGHWAETLDPQMKKAEIKEFYAADTAPERREEIIRRHHVRYAVWSEREREIGRFDPGGEPGTWMKVFEQDRFIVYRRITHE